VHAHTHTHTHAHKHANTHTHARTHAHMHAHTHTLSLSLSLAFARALSLYRFLCLSRFFARSLSHIQARTCTQNRIFNKYMPLTARQTFPSAATQLQVCWDICLEQYTSRTACRYGLRTIRPSHLLPHSCRSVDVNIGLELYESCLACRYESCLACRYDSCLACRDKSCLACRVESCLACRVQCCLACRAESCLACRDESRTSRHSYLLPHSCRSVEILVTNYMSHELHIDLGYVLADIPICRFTATGLSSHQLNAGIGHVAT